MPATMTAPPKVAESRVARAEEEPKLNVEVSFEKGLARPRYSHIKYGGPLALPAGWEMHPGFIAYGTPDIRVEVAIKEQLFRFQRDAAGLPMLHIGHVTNPFFPPLRAAFLGSDPGKPESNRCTLIWRAVGDAHQSAGYILYVTDQTGMNLRAIPLAIGNLELQQLMRQQAEQNLRDGKLAAQRSDPVEFSDSNQLHLELWKEGGRIHYSIFDYDFLGKLPITFDPLFRFAPDREYVIHFKATRGLRFEPYPPPDKRGRADSKKEIYPKIDWYNSVTATRVRQPERVRIKPVDETSFYMIYRPSSLPAPNPHDLPEPGWLTSFFLAGWTEDSPDPIWTDPTVADEGAEDPP